MIYVYAIVLAALLLGVWFPFLAILVCFAVGGVALMYVHRPMWYANVMYAIGRFIAWVRTW